MTASINKLEETASLTSWIILFNVIATTILAFISSTAIIVADSSIVGDLGIEGSIKQWTVILYLLGANSLIPIGTWLADRFGFKKVFSIGISLFALGSLISGLSFNFFTISIGRIVEGIGGGLIFPVGLALILHNFPKRQLPLVLNLYIGLGFGVGFGLGAFLGGFFTQFYSWKWIFLVNVPICIISLFIISISQKETEKKNLGKFDLFGYLTFSMCVCFLIVALTNGNLRSTTYGWRSPVIISLIILSVFFLALSLVIEKLHKNPIIPLKLFKYPIFVIGIFALFSLGMVVFGSVTMVSNFMEHGLMFQKFTIGSMLVIYGAAIGFFSVLSTFLIRSLPILLVISIGLILVIYSNVLNNQLTFLSDKTMISVILLIRGMGVGLSLGPINTYALQNVPKELSSEAATLLTFFRQVGATYGGSILSIIMIRREFFYNSIFSEGVTIGNIGLKETMRKMSMFLAKEHGGSALAARLRAQELIKENVLNQSFIQAMNDGLIVLAWILAIVGITMIILNFLKKRSIL